MFAPAWLPFYPGDYLRDTSRLSTEQHGAYFLLLLDEWSTGPLHDDDDQLAAIARLPVDRWRAIRPAIARFFVIEAGLWTNKRLEAERARTERILRQRAENGRRGGLARSKKINGILSNGIARLKQNDANHIHKGSADQGKKEAEAASLISDSECEGNVVPLRGRP